MLAGSAKQTDNGGGPEGISPPKARSPEAGNARGERDRRKQQRKADPIGRRAGLCRLRFVCRDRGIGCVLAQRHWNSPSSQKNKGPGGPGLLPSCRGAYFSEELIEPNLVFIVLPRLLTTVMMA